MVKQLRIHIKTNEVFDPRGTLIWWFWQIIDLIILKMARFDLIECNSLKVTLN